MHGNVGRRRNGAATKGLDQEIHSRLVTAGTISILALLESCVQVRRVVATIGMNNTL